MIKIMYLFEYFCYPIWLYENPNKMYDVQNISVFNLPISEKLKKEIDELDIIYQSTYNEDYPSDPKKLSYEETLIFCKRVLLSAENLKKELPSFYILIFDNKILIEFPKMFKK